MKALLIVDLQLDFCPGGALAVQEGDLIVPLVNELMIKGGFDTVIATKDWHPSNHQCFSSNNPGTAVFEEVVQNGIKQTLWPTHCVQNTDGAKFHPDLRADLIDKIILKGTNPEIDSLSGFFDNAHNSETELRGFLDQIANSKGLRREQIELVICGLAIDYCVGLTALDAAKLGFKTSVVLDAGRSVNLKPEDEMKMLRALVQAGVTLTDSRSILREQEVGREIAPGLSGAQGISLNV